MDRLKTLRQKAGRSMKDTAELLGIPYTTYVSYEKGAREPNSEMLVRIAEFYCTTVDYLIGRSDIADAFSREAPPTTKVVQFSNRSEKAPSLSDEALEIAHGYEELDHWGKVAVRELLDTERQRVEDDRQFRIEALMDAEPKIINLYTEPAAAGIATPTAGVDFHPYELKPSDPQGAAYAVYIQGNSMEPAFPDGSIAFVNHDAIRNGDIGIFCVNGGTVCKQYYRDPMGGVVNLLSLNRKRADADVTVYPGSNETLICQGRVITKKKFPLPEGHM